MSREQLIAAAVSPKKRFASMELGSSRTIRLRAVSQAPCYWFERHQEMVLSDGTYAVDPSRATVTMVTDGIPAVLFYLVGRRLESCTFVFNLSARQLTDAVGAMRRAKLAALISPAASNALENLPGARRSELEEHLRKLVTTPSKSRVSAPGKVQTKPPDSGRSK